MTTEAKKNSSGLDMLLTVVSIAILIAAIVGFNQFSEYSVLARALAVVAAAIIAAAVFTRTTTGASAWEYIVSSRTELRKVVWPTRQETMQTTLIVILFTVFLAVFLWLIDMVLLAGVSWITGRGDL